MTTNSQTEKELLAHLQDLKQSGKKWHKSVASMFLNEEEQSIAQLHFPENGTTRYFGGYPNARKKKVIFLFEEGDDFLDIVCLQAKVDQRFGSIGHRDILGALMSLQIDRHTFGDFWVESDVLTLYTQPSTARFFIDNFHRIGRLSIALHEVENGPSQTFVQKEIHCVVASLRMDAIVASLAHISRQQAKEMIENKLVQRNHRQLVHAGEICNNNDTISIRGVGRFTFTGDTRNTHSGRMMACFLQDI